MGEIWLNRETGPYHEYLPRVVINNTPTIQPSVLSDDTSDDSRETETETTHKKPTDKKSKVWRSYIKGVSEQVRRLFKQ